MVKIVEAPAGIEGQGFFATSFDFLEGANAVKKGNAQWRWHQGRGTIKVIHSHFKPKLITTFAWDERTASR